MNDFISLSCPSCGARLEITEDINRFICSHCGNEHMIKRAGGIISVTPVVEAIKKVEVGIDRTASELALQRLKSDLAQLESQKKEILQATKADGYKQSYTPIVMGIFGICILLVGILFSLLTGYKQYEGSYLGIIIIGLIIAVPSIFRAWRNNSSQRAYQSRQLIRDQSLAKLEKSIAVIQNNIERHSNLVSRY